MEHKGDEQPSLNDTRHPHSLEQGTVPASLLPSVLSRLGLGDMASLSFTGVDTQLAALKDAEIPVRVAAVRILGEQAEASTIGPLVAALHDSAWEVRAAAVWALGKFGEQAPREALMRATDDEDGSVRAAALRTLELLGDRVSKEPLIRALGDSDWQVREIATLTLGELGEQAPLDPLLARLNDERTAVRDAARIALEESHPEALLAISIESSMITQESDSNTVSGMREQEQPWPGVEVEARAKAPSHGDSTLIQLTSHARTLLSRVVRDVVAPLAGMRSTSTDEELSDVIVSEPGEMEAHPQPIQIKPRRLRHIAEGFLAALIIAGLVASWLAIEHRLHPSQGSSSALLTYRGPVDGPAVWSSDSKYVSFLANPTPAGETVLVWNRATGQLTRHMLHTLLTQAQANHGVFAPDGKHLAFVEIDASHKVAVQVWDVIAWHRILTTSLSSPSGFLDVYWSPDSTRFVVPGEDGTIQVWNVVTGHEQMACHVPPLDNLPSGIYMSPDGHSAIFGYGPQKTYVLNLTICKLLTLPSSDSNFTVWSPQENRFATISLTDASMVQVWDAHTGRTLASFHLSAPVSDTGLVWTPDGTRIVTWGDKEVDVLDIATRRFVLKVVPTRIDLLPVWALSPDGGHIASLSAADAVQIWDAITGRKLNVYQSPGNSVKVVAWSPDSRTIAAGSTNGTVRVWYADRSPQTYRSDSSAVLNITWSPDGRSIATGNLDGGIWVWTVN